MDVMSMLCVLSVCVCVFAIFMQPDIWISVLMMMVVLTLFMKLISYAHVNHDLRVLDCTL